MSVGPHTHKFDTNSARTERACVKCGTHQVKVSGKWKAAG